MKNTIISLIAALAVFTAKADTNSLFNSRELSISIGSSYGLDGHYDANLSVGASYSFTKNFILESELPVYQSQGTSVDRVSAGLAYRYPVARIFAPTIRAGTTYAWNTKDFDGYFGGGLEIKLNKFWSLTPGIDYQFINFNSFDKGTWSPSVKLKLTF